MSRKADNVKNVLAPLFIEIYHQKILVKAKLCSRNVGFFCFIVSVNNRNINPF